MVLTFNLLSPAPRQTMTTQIRPLRARPRGTARRNRFARQGVATVEFAVIVPLLVILFFGGITATHMVSLKHQATIIAHTAALDAMKAENDFATVETRSKAFAQSAGLNNVDVTVSMSGAEIVSVEVSIPVSGNFSLSNSSTPESVKSTAFAFRPASP